MTPRSTIILSH